MEPQSAPKWPSEEPEEGRGKLVVVLPLVLALLVGVAAAAYALGWVRYARGNVAPTPPPARPAEHRRRQPRGGRGRADQSSGKA